MQPRLFDLVHYIGAPPSRNVCVSSLEDFAEEGRRLWLIRETDDGLMRFVKTKFARASTVITGTRGEKLMQIESTVYAFTETELRALLEQAYYFGRR